jgi:branched-chain amino acid transport system permease protein
VTEFVNLLISGVSLGFVYGLIALGFVVLYKATGVVNFAHGAVLLLGGYTIAVLHDHHVGFWWAALAGLAVAGFAGLVIERLLIRPLRGADVNSLAILTIGVNIILVAELTRRIGSQVFSLGDPWGSKVLHFGGYTIPETRIAAIVVGFVLIIGFIAVTKFTNWGIAMRAAAEDGEVAALMGIRLGRVAIVSWVVAGVLAAVASIFLTAFPSPGLDNTVAVLALAAFPAAILGGLDSTTGALAGGIAVGLAQTLTAGYEGNLTFLGRGVSSIVPYAIMILVLLWRPSGLFGTREVTRV